MATRRAVMLTAALVVFGASLALAATVGLPPVSRGGELAYVREYPEDALATAASGEHLTATYVAFTLDDHPQRDRVLRFESRGRVADTELFHRADLPDGTFTDLRFHAVDHVERGVLVGEGPDACFAALNGVNAGTDLVAKNALEARYLATGEFDLQQTAPGEVQIHRDGHTYLLQVVGTGNLSVDGGNIRAVLAPGDELRGWIDGEYPATTKVMHHAFDEVSAACNASAPAPGGNETDGNETGGNQTPPPPPPPTYGPDAAVDKTVTAQDEETVTFGLVAENLGDFEVRQVVLADPLPEVAGEWFLGGADSERCSLEGDDLTCDFGTLAPGEGRSVTVRGYVQGMCGELVNTASVTGAQDQDATNNEDSAVAQLPPCEEAQPDVRVFKEVSAQDNETVTFGLTVASVGDADATDVVLSDPLPEVSGDWFLAGADAEACSLDGDDLTCDFGTLASGQTREVQVRGYVQGMCGELTNTAGVSAAEDARQGNNQASATADLGPCPTPDVGVEKAVVAQDNETVTFGLTVTSLGEAAADDVVLTDALPPVSGDWFLAGPDAGACILEGDHLACEFGTMAPDEVRQVSVRGYVRDLCGPLENTAEVTATGDGDPDNDEATATADLGPCDQPVPDAATTKTASQDEFAVVFTLAVDSVGDATVHNVSLFDDLPDIGREWYLGGTDSEACTLEGNSLSCAFGDLEPGAHRQVTVKAYTDELPCGEPIENVAWLEADDDGNAANDQDSASIQRAACEPPEGNQTA